jgi:hypothetical protein
MLLASLDPKQPGQAFGARYQLPFPVGNVDYQKARDFMQFSVMTNAYVPWVVFIDRKGMIRAQFTGNEPFFNNVEGGVKEWGDKLLAESATPARRTRRK